MKTLGAMQLLGKRVLVTRNSARELQNALSTMLAQHDDEVAIDFGGVEGVTPSFVDELLLVIEETPRRSSPSNGLRVVFLHPPTRLSTKFAAVGRAHGLLIDEAPDGSWILRVPASATNSAP
jgi:hypothetical protein